MLNITSDRPILEEVAHRPWPIPNQRWVWYQEWNDVAFLHWKVPEAWLKPQVPKGLTIDTFEGACWISLVAFTMNNVRPYSLPAFTPLSNFFELNIRTYVTNGGKAGVYFLSIEASKQIACLMAQSFSGLPYQYAAMERTSERFQSHNARTGNRFDIAFQTGTPTQAKPLDLWLTERYCLYQDVSDVLYRYEVQHKQWDVYQMALTQSAIQYRGYENIINRPPDRLHYSPGVPVLAFAKEKTQ